ncbi:MAG: acidic ribosomal protein P0 [Thermoplasmatales archaeon E-plasma]|nr:MAG: acidic ribosomal protein P0 [Thermoplasmatales archaeon E-plasma]
MTEPAKWKVELVNQVTSEMDQSPVSAIVSIKGIRNKQLQQIRRSLKGKAKLRVMRGTLVEKSLENVKKDHIGDLKEFISGQIALITTEMTPQKLYASLEGSKQKAAARGGETATEDIIIEAKETQFPPGPMISEFQKVGLQTAIEKGKIVIKKESVFVKKGEKISKEKAKILEKLEIHPITVGLDVVSAYYDGLIFKADVLSITPEFVMGEIAMAFSRAKVLAGSVMFITKEIVPELIIKGRLQAESLGMEAKFLDEKEMGNLIINSRAAVQKTETKENAHKEELKEEKNEEKEAEDATEGFGALFG